MEQWKEVKDYKGYYVSTLGRVYSSKTRRVIKPWIDSKGHYLLVALSINGVKKNKSVHRLVAQAFIENANNLPEVNHIDFDKKNNKLENLEWCDRRGNMHHSFKKHSPVKYSIPCTLYAKDYQIRSFLSIIDCCRYASKIFGLSSSMLNKFKQQGDFKIIPKIATTSSNERTSEDKLLMEAPTILNLIELGEDEDIV